MTYDLSRFHTAQGYTYDGYETALAEIRRGRKESHWMWYIFPQLKGLGRSAVAQFYGISGLEEAREYLNDPILGAHLREISQALLDQPVRNAHAIFGHTDTMKLRSCMTLFEAADPAQTVFAQVLEEFFGGSRDHQTLKRL